MYGLSIYLLTFDLEWHLKCKIKVIDSSVGCISSTVHVIFMKLYFSLPHDLWPKIIFKRLIKVTKRSMDVSRK